MGQFLSVFVSIEEIPSTRAIRGENYPVTMVLDLCLFRVVTERCGGRVLPFGVRQMIKDYAFEVIVFNNMTLWTAVQLWVSDRAKALQLYGDINDWDVSRVTNMDALFRYLSFNDRIDRWDVRKVTSMGHMFAFVKDFNQPLNTWRVEQVTDMRHMFHGASSFNQPLDTWDVRNVTCMSSMFADATAFNQPLTEWEVSSVTDTKEMFRGASSFNQPLGAWNDR